ncbi:(deoxy)nucleoside triphosphate pyrophosphohydrolase [uncultured Draconibacterium sp.]|uniref:(deoxy)nucleoside triphosphate pyrophosphohydrolase n=1 Tax=uncultured Draconibacterium sp. TaxID=1573823 RepID=UPI003217EAB1
MIQVTCALIVSEGKVLIAQNKEDSDHPFQWEFPGGKLKAGETEEQCICREIKEELELEIRILERLLGVEYDYGIKKIELIPFVCSIESGELKLNDHIKTAWVEMAELGTVDFSAADKKLIGIDSNQKSLKKYTREQVD